MGTVKFALLSWFSIVRDVWRQQFFVLSEKTNNISVVSSHFHLYLRISALRLPTVYYKELMKNTMINTTFLSLQWRHNERDGISNHPRDDCLLSRLFRCRSKKIEKIRVTGLCAGKSPVNSPYKGSVTQKMSAFDDVIMHHRESETAYN